MDVLWRAGPLLYKLSRFDGREFCHSDEKSLARGEQTTLAFRSGNEWRRLQNKKRECGRAIIRDKTYSGKYSDARQRIQSRTEAKKEKSGNGQEAPGVSPCGQRGFVILPWGDSCGFWSGRWYGDSAWIIIPPSPGGSGVVISGLGTVIIGG